MHERDILAQMQALHIINKFPIHQTYTTLVEIVKNERLFYKLIIKLKYLSTFLGFV